MPNEFFLIIFLLVAMLVFVYFYAKRAQNRTVTTTPADVEHASEEPPAAD